MLTLEELRLLRQKRSRLLVTIGVVLVFLIGGYFAARPTRNAIKGWQARRHAQKAFESIDKEKWKEARDEAVAAYQLRQTEPEGLRAVARFLSRTRQQQALEFWDQLSQREKLTREDLRDEAAVALVNGELNRATTTIDQLLAGDGKKPSPHDWLLATQLRLQQGLAEAALESLGKLIADPAATPREQFQATLLQLQAARTSNSETDSRNQAEAWQRLSKFARGDDAVALDALVILAQRELSQKSGEENLKSQVTDQAPENSGANPLVGLSPADLSLSDLIRLLESHPFAKAPQKLLAIELRLHADSSQRDALIDRAIAEWKEGDAESLAALGKWLNGKGEFQRQLDEIPSEKALGSRELFLQHVDALGALSRWDEIRRLLESERFPLDPVMQRMYLARCNAQLGNEAAAKNNWDRALEATTGDMGKLITLAEYAEKNGAVEVAGSAYTQATIAAPKLRAAWQGRLRTVYSTHETKQIHAVLTEMVKLWPSDPAIQNDEGYLRLLMLGDDSSGGEQLNDIEKLAQDLVQKEPASLPHRTLLALARLRQNRPVAALQVYDNINVAANALSPSALAVHAAVLAANDQREAARNEIAQVPEDKLLPEEQAGTADLRR